MEKTDTHQNKVVYMIANIPYKCSDEASLHHYIYSQDVLVSAGKGVTKIGRTGEQGQGGVKICKYRTSFMDGPVVVSA